jgi:HK97 family phage portal protein
MAYLQDLLNSQTEIIRQQQITSQREFGLVSNEAYSQYFPTWEVTAPQYMYPQAWSLASLSYKTNEVAYACIDKRMKAISEPMLKIYNKDTDEEEPIDEFYKFMEEPTPDLSQSEYLAAIEMYLCIAGFMSWEKDYKNNGKLNALWPMMPQYCSFMRGQGKLLRAIRYLPYTGLPAVDIKRDKVVLFMYADPQYFGLRPLSPTAVLGDIIKVDNDLTVMLETFIQNGAFVSGLLSTEQVINEADARFAKERFRQSHGGPKNAGDVVVTGKGLKFERMGQTFQEMVFPEVDARSETRICMGYAVPPILVAAKSGMDRATYSNYEQARGAWYEEFIPAEWKFIQQSMTRDLLPHFTDNKKLEIRFDVSRVKALEAMREKDEERTVNQAKANLITRDEARLDLGKDVIDNAPVFVGVTSQQQLSEVEEVFKVGGGSSDTLTRVGEKDADNDERMENSKERIELEKRKLKLKEMAGGEEKDFRAFAKRRIKENKHYDIGEFEFKYVDDVRQRQLLSEFGVPDPDAQLVLEGLKQVLLQMGNKSTSPSNINITANIHPNESTQVEIKSVDIPAPIVNVDVNPTPIENKITVNNPKIKRTTQKVKRDGGNNIDGTIAEYEYEE